MPDKVGFNRALNIIEVDSYGVVTKDDISSSIEKIQQIQEETDVGKLLVDTTGQGTLPSTIEIFEIFSEHATMVA